MEEEKSGRAILARHTTQETVVDYLRNLILSHQLMPGERLVQSDLAEELGVSRTPVRESLHQLASEGLVTNSAFKGASVADFSLGELEEIYCVRIGLEGYAAYLATQLITERDIQQLKSLVGQMKTVFKLGDRLRSLEVNRDFYSVLYAIPAQQRLYDMIMQHLDLSNVYRHMAFSLDSLYTSTVADHEELLAVLRRRDAEMAEHLTRIWLRETADALIQLLQENQPQ
ncbi:MAG: GntR family transcriptional regulator [Candidatus Promineifilaceae bacterium]